MRAAKISPWKHQIECINAVRNAYRAGKRMVLTVMASGLGKTYTAGFIYRFLRQSAQRVGRRSRLLFLAHQKDLLDQAHLSFNAVFGEKLRYGLFTGQTKDAHADVVFATFQSIRKAVVDGRRKSRRPFGPIGFDYLIVDESHHGHAPTYREVIQYFRPRFLLGMTATPDRMDMRDIREIFGQEVYTRNLEEAMLGGLLTPVKYFVMADEIVDKAKLKVPPHLITIQKLNRIFFSRKRDEEVAQTILNQTSKLPEPRILVFTASIKHAERFAELLPGAATIHSEVPPIERARRMDLIRRGLIRVAITVDQFNEGIDIPEANVLVFLRSTQSKTIFFQQLGRGLRRVRGKQLVTVLDFVANCERLLLLNEFRGRLKGKKHKRGGKRHEFAVDWGEVVFEKRAQDIVHLLSQIRTRPAYTREILIRQLCELGKTLKRIPGQKDVQAASKLGTIAGYTTYQRLFGTLTAALKAAGFRPIRSWGESRESALKKLRVLAKKLGHTPSSTEIHAAYKEGECVSTTVFYRKFGSIVAAQKAAGLIPARTTRRYSRSELVKQLKGLAKKLERTPRISDVTKASKEDRCASPVTFAKTFGSFAEASVAAGLMPWTMFRLPNKRLASRKLQQLDNPTLLLVLKRLRKKLGRTPSRSDIDRAARQDFCVSSGTYARRFGSLQAAQKAAGMPVLQIERSPDEHVRSLKKLAKKLSRIPSTYDVDVANQRGECASVSQLHMTFGTFNNALRAAGMQPTRIRGYTRQQLIEQLRQLQYELKRVPFCSDVIRASKEKKGPSLEPYRNVFGSFSAAKKAALQSRKQRITTGRRKRK